jgi:SAM-dependent methyltransferase
MANLEPSIGIDLSDADRVATVIARFLPASLVPIFDARFTRSDRLFDEYVSRLARQVICDVKLDQALGTWGTTEELVARARLDPSSAIVPVDWMLRRLAERNLVEVLDGPGGRQFRAAHPIGVLDAAEVREAQQQHDAAALASYALAETAARAYPAFLEGTSTGEDLLLAPARLAMWNGYFSNDHSLYAVNNRVGAVALAAWLGPGPHTILELGAGMGSGTVAALDALSRDARLDDVEAYRVTDIVPVFLRYAERRVREQPRPAPTVTFEKLDMNRSFAAQGVPEGAVSAVYAVNTLHVAHDLAVTLDEVRRALMPGGQLIVSECVRPLPGKTLYPEFVFNMLSTFRAPRLHPGYRPNGGFLTPEQWRAAFEEAGFVDVRMLPDIERIRDVVPNFAIAAIVGTRAS